MATIYLNSGDSVDVYGQSQIYGSGDVENVIIRPGALNVTLSPAVERAHFAGPSTDYRFAASGASLKVYNLDGDLVATLTAGAKPTLLFADGGIRVGADVNTGGVTLGGRGISGDPAPFAGTPDMNLGQSLIGNEPSNPSDPSGPDDPGKDDPSKDPSRPDDPSKDDPSKDDPGKDPSKPDDSGQDDPGKDPSKPGTDDSGKEPGKDDGGSQPPSVVPAGHKYMVLQVGSLESSNFTGFKFSQGGKDYEVKLDAPYTGSNATYEGLAAKIQDAIRNDATLSKLDLGVLMGDEFTEFGPRSGSSALGTDIVIESGLGLLKVSKEKNPSLPSNTEIFTQDVYGGSVKALPPYITDIDPNDFLILQIIDGHDAVAAREKTLTDPEDGHTIVQQEYGTLFHNPFTAFKFKVNGVEKTINLMDEYNWRTDHSPTYAELAQKLRDGIDADPQLKDLGLEVSLGNYFDTTLGVEFGTHADKSVLGKQIVISSNKKGTTLDPIDGDPYGGWVPNDTLTNDHGKPGSEQQPLSHMWATTSKAKHFPEGNEAQPGEFPSLDHWLYIDLINHDGVVKARDEGTAPQYGALADNPFTRIVVTDSTGATHNIDFKYNSSVDITPTYAELLQSILDGYNEAVKTDVALAALDLKFELGGRFSTKEGGTTRVGKHENDLVNGTRIVVSAKNDKLQSIELQYDKDPAPDRVDYTNNEDDPVPGWYVGIGEDDSFYAPKPETAPDKATTGLKIAIDNMTTNQFTGLEFTWSTGLKGETEAKTFTLDWSQYNAAAATKYTGTGANYNTLLAAIKKAITDQNAKDPEFKFMDLDAELGQDPVSGRDVIILSSKDQTINKENDLPYGTPKGELGEVALLHNGVAESALTSKGDVSTNLDTYSPFSATHTGLAIHILNAKTADNAVNIGISKKHDAANMVLDEQHGALLDNMNTGFTLKLNGVTYTVKADEPYNGLADGTVPAKPLPTYEGLKDVIATAITTAKGEPGGLTGLAGIVTLGNAFVGEYEKADKTTVLGHGLQINLSTAIVGSDGLMVPLEWIMQVTDPDTGDPIDLSGNETKAEIHVFTTDYGLF